MPVVINPGSGPVEDSVPGGNTVEQARVNAAEWLQIIHRAGMTDVELLPGEEDTSDGRWRFRFRHGVTDVVCDLDIHGLTPDGWQALRERSWIGAGPRVYWRGSSSSDPELEDWAAPGFEAVRTYRPVTS